MIIAVLFVIGALGPMARYNLTAFYPYIAEETGWSRSIIGTAQTLSLWVYSFASILTGWMIDKLGSRRTLMIGGVLCILGWALFSTVDSLWHLYLYYGIVLALATSNTHLVPLQATSRKWFIKRAGLAGGIVGSALAIGTAVITPLLTWLAGKYGWQEVSLAAGFAFGLPVIFLAWFFIRDTPEKIGLRPDGESVLPEKESPLHMDDVHEYTVKSALKTVRFWQLFLAYGLIGIVFNGLLAHLVVWAVDVGSTASSAGMYVTLLNGPSIIARVGSGWLGDRLGKRRIMVFGASISAVTMFFGWQMIESADTLLFFCPLFGLGAGITGVLFAPYLGDLFGRKIVGSLFGILTLSWGLIGGLGPVVWGLLIDTYGSYSPALALSASCYLAAALLMFTIREKHATVPGKR